MPSEQGDGTTILMVSYYYCLHKQIETEWRELKAGLTDFSKNTWWTNYKHQEKR